MDLATKTPQGLKLWFSSYQCSCKGVEAVNNSAVSGFQVLSLGSHYSFNATQDWKEISWSVLPSSIQWPHLDPGNCSLHFWNALCDHSVAVSIQGNSEVRIVFSCVLIADGKMWTDGEAEITVCMSVVVPYCRTPVLSALISPWEISFKTNHVFIYQGWKSFATPVNTFSGSFRLYCFPAFDCIAFNSFIYSKETINI